MGYHGVGLLILLPAFSWLKFYFDYKRFKSEEARREKENDFLNRHNCVVTYSPLHGVQGYMGPHNKIPQNLDACTTYLEPLIHFIETAEKNISIAVMTFTLQVLYDALMEKLDKGVSVRILVNHQMMEDINEFSKLQEHGAKIMMFYDGDAIMHYKFAVKDHTPAEPGQLVMGSMNWTQRSAFENYDCLVFTTAPTVVEEFYKKFDHTWGIIERQKLFR